ncbi:MAG: redoxin domain-containing protein [Rhizobacter sp.]|nr:redoxin domain-containing protein [Ferruginibacter sp.]
MLNHELIDEKKLSSLEAATGWLNSPPLKALDLKGKVIVINFCTYSCINWIRTLPYMRAWSEKYKEHGLVVIGIHTPEFEFEKNEKNIKQALKAFNISYPVAIDNNYDIWNAFNNQYWPALYFVDAKGNIRHHYFGEGNYEQSEQVIQQLLAQATGKKIDQALSAAQGQGIEVAADWANLKSPENYLGYERTLNFRSGSVKRNILKTYAAPKSLQLNQWALSGDWTMKPKLIELNKKVGRIVYRFHSRDLNMVMGPGIAGNVVRFRILIDGELTGAAHGVDVDAEGYGTVTEQRLYQLVRQTGRVVERQFEIIFLDPAVEAFSFTFG